MMKRVLSIIMVIALIFANGVSVLAAERGDAISPVVDENPFENTYELIIEDGIVTGYTGTPVDLEIPSTVTEIADSAFQGCNSLKSVKIPDSVIEMGYCAFAECNNLTSIEIPSSVKVIPYGAFFECTSLVSVKFSTSVEKIGSRAFQGCSSLKTLVLPIGVEEIDSYAFYDCSNLTSIEIPKGVEKIGFLAFHGCSNLASIELPSSIKEIGSFAFQGCSSLTSVEIPEGVEEIAHSLFAVCSSLTSVEIPSSVKKIGGGAFQGCSSLTSIEIPSSVEVIESFAFDGCSSLTSIVIPSSVKVIESFAFMDCSNLTSIAIPTGVEEIGDYAFAHCSSLKSVDVSSSVKKIGEYVFQDVNGTFYVVKDSCVETYLKKNYSSADIRTKKVKDIEKATVKLSKTSYSYNDKEKKPTVTVTLNGKTLVKDTDYIVRYENNKNIGEATVTILGNGKYDGAITKTFTIKAKKGTTFTSGKYKYKVTSTSTVAFDGIVSAKTTKVTIPKTVEYGGATFKVTAIAEGALKKATKITQVTIGANVEKIGKSAFEGCKNLKTITIKSTKIKSVGEKSLKGIYSKATIKVPKKNYATYKKILKKGGLGSKVKIGKY